MRVAGLILAGGRATRLGGIDKPLLSIGDMSMLARIIATLQSDTAALAISANGDPARFARFDLPVLPDNEFAGEGPLAGVLSGLDWASNVSAEALLTVPGDTPFIPPGLAASLLPPPACASTGGRAHPLVALWPLDCRAALRRTLSTPGHRAVLGFTERIGMRRVDFPVSKWDRFLNVNTADDLAMAQALAAGQENSV